MQHLSAPRPGGTLAALAAAPHADVVFVCHVGVPVGIGELWRMLGGGRRIELRLWFVAREQIPSGQDERIDWLFGWWRTLDGWIDAHRDGTGAQRRTAPSAHQRRPARGDE